MAKLLKNGVRLFSLLSLCLCEASRGIVVRTYEYGNYSSGMAELSAAALAERSAAFVPIQRTQASFPPAQNVNSAASRERPASHFSG